MLLRLWPICLYKGVSQRGGLVSPFAPFLFAAKGSNGMREREGGGGLHRFPVAGLPEDFRGHVARRAAGGGKDVKGLVVHYSRETKIGNQKIGIVLWRAEKEILGFQVPVNDAVVVEVGYGREGGAYEVCSVGLEVASLATYSIKELSAKG